MTLKDIKSDISSSRVALRTLSQYHLFPGPPCPPSQEVLWKILDLSGGALCLSQVVPLR
jgi:hypothetical protein